MLQDIGEEALLSPEAFCLRESWVQGGNEEVGVFGYTVDSPLGAIFENEARDNGKKGRTQDH